MRSVLLMFVILWFSESSVAQEGKDILKKHFSAHGQDLWDQVGSVIVDGKWVNENYESYRFKLTHKGPDKTRIEGLWKGKGFIEATNGKVAWTIAPWTGSRQVQLMTSEEQLVILNAYHLGSPLALHRSDLTFAGLEDFQGELMIKFIYEDEFIKKNFYLGRKDARLFWETIETKLGNKSTRIKKQFEKYREYNGLLVPTAVRIFSESAEKELIFDDVALGIGAKSSLFDMPKRQ